MKTKLLLYTFLLLLLSGCLIREDDFISKYCPGSCTVIAGRLTTDDGNTPLAGVSMEVKWQWRATFGLGFNKDRRKAVATTDANGNYELRFLLRDNELPNNSNDGQVTVAFILDQDKYFTPDPYNSFSQNHQLKRDTTFSVNYNLPQKAFVELQPSNTSAMKPDDRFATELEFTGGENNAQHLGQTLYWNSETPATSTTVAVAANQQVIIRTRKTKNGTSSVSESKLLLKPSQRIRHEVSF